MAHGDELHVSGRSPTSEDTVSKAVDSLYFLYPATRRGKSLRTGNLEAPSVRPPTALSFSSWAEVQVLSERGCPVTNRRGGLRAFAFSLRNYKAWGVCSCGLKSRLGEGCKFKVYYKGVWFQSCPSPIGPL